MNPLRLAAIVEGHGEVEAVPILIRRIAGEAYPDATVEVTPVLRVVEPSFFLKKEPERPSQ